MTKTDMFDFIVFYNSLTSVGKRQFISSIISGSGDASPGGESAEELACPFCASTVLVRNGKSKGKQRYLCRQCRKTFIGGNDVKIYYSHYSVEVWLKYLNCMASNYSIRRSGEECGIALYTSFKWRHKILEAMRIWREKEESGRDSV